MKRHATTWISLLFAVIWLGIALTQAPQALIIAAIWWGWGCLAWWVTRPKRGDSQGVGTQQLASVFEQALTDAEAIGRAGARNAADAYLESRLGPRQ